MEEGLSPNSTGYNYETTVAHKNRRSFTNTGFAVTDAIREPSGGDLDGHAVPPLQRQVADASRCVRKIVPNENPPVVGSGFVGLALDDDDAIAELGHVAHESIEPEV